MTQYIDKSALVAEIERMKVDAIQFPFEEYGTVGTCNKLLSFLDTVEVKEANEALRTEYKKGRADVIADTLSWLDNCWPRYCSNQTIIEGFKEAIKE
jgi:hypothetical protein